MLQSPFYLRSQIAQPLWGTARRLRRVGMRGFRRLQFTSLLLTRSYWGLLRALNWWDIIDEHFLLGGTLMFDDVERLQGQGVRAVVNLCAERQDDQHKLQAAHMEYLWLPVLDACPPTLEQILQGMTWMEQQLHAGRMVYIHCAAGVGRSATLLACWYVYARGMSVSLALRLIKMRRPQVALTRLQVRRLREFEALLHNAEKLSHHWPYVSTRWWASSN